MSRTLAVRLQPDWRAARRGAAVAACRGFAARRSAAYQGEVLNFESPAVFFAQLSERRWVIVRTLQDAGPLAVRELARRVGRDVKRVHEVVQVLAGLGWSSAGTAARCCARLRTSTSTCICRLRRCRRLDRGSCKSPDSGDAREPLRRVSVAISAHHDQRGQPDEHQSVGLRFEYRNHVAETHRRGVKLLGLDLDGLAAGDRHPVNEEVGNLR